MNHELLTIDLHVAFLISTGCVINMNLRGLPLCQVGMQHSISQTEIPDRVGQALRAWSFCLAFDMYLDIKYPRYRVNPREFMCTRLIFGMETYSWYVQLLPEFVL